MTKIYSLSVFFFLVFGLQFAYSINPMKEYKLKPDQFKIEYKELKINTSDGASLNTWVMNTQAEDKKDMTIVLAGSDAGNMGFSLAYANFFLYAGYDVITFDYRGFGASSSFEHNPNYLYHEEYIEDFKSVINWTKKELKTKNIGVMAFSMGTLIATAEFESAPFEILIAECFVKCPQKVAQRINKTKDKEIASPTPSKSICKRTSKIDIPMLLIASKEDETTTLKDSQQVVKQRKNRTLVVHDGKHLRGVVALGMETYFNNVKTFLDGASH